MKGQDRQQLKTFEREMRGYTESYLGYPVNAEPKYRFLSPFLDLRLNNIGDPFVPSSFKINSRRFEREVLRFFAKLYKMPQEDFWGYVTSGGTEGNLYGLFVARELYPDGILYFSEDAHYSIRKIARILNMRSIVVRSSERGEMDYEDFEKLVNAHRENPAIVNANIGTTMKGAVDDVPRILDILDRGSVSERYIHCDAALFGMILPFVDPTYPSFTMPIGSIAISGHKFIGSPVPCGVALARREYVRRIERKVEYIGSMDTTVSGSRSGLSPLILWSAIREHGRSGFAREAKTCVARAQWLLAQLQEMHWPAFLNEHSNTVVLKPPPTKIAQKWQLAVQGQWAHVVVLQHVTKERLEKFLGDLRRGRVTAS